MTPQAFTWGPGGARMTPEQIAAQKKVAQALMEKGMDYSPVQSPWQGAARVAQALYGGLEGAQADRASATNAEADRAMIASLLGGGAASAPTVPAAAPAPGPMSSTGDPASAIAGIESGGRYDALGPVTKTGDRAYGKYQVMGANVPVWTKAHLGQEMTPEQFVANPQAQDAVFKGQFGQYANKYGPEGAAKAWFAGEGGMNNPNAKDILGTTVSEYAAKFRRGMGGQQMAQSQSPMAGVNPAVIQAITSPYAGDGPKAIAKLLLTQQLKPNDYDIQQRPDGTVIAVNKKNPTDVQVINAPGAGDSAIQFEADKAAAIATAKGQAEKALGAGERRLQEVNVGTIVTQDVDRAIDLIDKNPLTTTGVVGPWLSKIGGTPAANVRALVDTVKANAGFAELQKMRNNSPTGGALGQVSEREIAYLQATIGNMEQSQTADQLKDNLLRVKNAYMDIVHGPGKGPARAKLGFQEKQGGDGWKDMGNGVRIREKR